MLVRLSGGAGRGATPGAAEGREEELRWKLRAVFGMEMCSMGAYGWGGRRAGSGSSAKVSSLPVASGSETSARPAAQSSPRWTSAV